MSILILSALERMLFTIQTLNAQEKQQTPKQRRGDQTLRKSNKTQILNTAVSTMYAIFHICA